MNKKGTRCTNGEGSISNVIAKQKRKKFLDAECKICSECKDRSACNNRQGYIKCEKCENCKEECLKYCDRFYCYERNQVQITIDGKQTTVASAKKRKDAISKKIEAEAKVQTKNYIKKNGLLLIDVCKNIQQKKIKAQKIGSSTADTDKYQFRYIESWEGFKKPVQKVTYQDVDDFLNSITHLSQSEIGHIYYKLKAAFHKCVIDKVISYPDNPMHKVTIPISNQTKKKVQAFEVEEQRKLMEYIRTQPLIKSAKCNYDEETLRNLLLLLFLTSARIGEICALDYDTRIEFIQKRLRIDRTLTKEDERVVMGKHTKTGRKKIQKGETDERFIPMDLFDEEEMIRILKSQIKIAKNNPKNKEHLLFCQNNGQYIIYTSIDAIFKRICREAGVKPELTTGCHVHMTRHTGATRMIESGMDIFVIAEILGHTDIEQLKKTYAHVFKKYRNKQLKTSQAYYVKEMKVS